MFPAKDSVLFPAKDSVLLPKGLESFLLTMKSPLASQAARLPSRQ